MKALRQIYKNSEITSFSDYIALQNTLLLKHFFSEEIPEQLNEDFKKLNDQHQSATRSSTQNSIFVPKVHTKTYRKNSIKYQSIKLWDNLKQILQSDLLQQTRGMQKNSFLNTSSTISKHN